MISYFRDSRDSEFHVEKINALSLLMPLSRMKFVNCHMYYVGLINLVEFAGISEEVRWNQGVTADKKIRGKSCI